MSKRLTHQQRLAKSLLKFDHSLDADLILEPLKQIMAFADSKRWPLMPKEFFDATDHKSITKAYHKATGHKIKRVVVASFDQLWPIPAWMSKSVAKEGRLLQIDLDYWDYLWRSLGADLWTSLAADRYSSITSR